MDKWLKTDVERARKKSAAKPIPAHHLWISHRTPQAKMQFFTVIVPMRKDDAEPAITAISDSEVRVQFRGRERRFSFGPDTTADLCVDLASLTR
jgi:hypothetical protein